MIVEDAAISKTRTRSSWNSLGGLEKLLPPASLEALGLTPL